MFDFFFKKKYFTIPEQDKILAAIREAEYCTSGEVRLYIESKCKTAVPLERAMAVFHSLKMDKTADRNAVILYIAMESRQLAIFGDEGIHNIVGQDYWDNTVMRLTANFKSDNMAGGIVGAIKDIGLKLQKYFPYRDDDKNELPDDIVFGK
ncbi:MAG: TPM domain-containing protein [Sediminibacterium sp.]